MQGCKKAFKSPWGGHRGLTGLICMAKTNSYETIKSGGHDPHGSRLRRLYMS